MLVVRSMKGGKSFEVCEDVEVSRAKSMLPRLSGAIRRDFFEALSLNMMAFFVTCKEGIVIRQRSFESMQKD